MKLLIVDDEEEIRTGISSIIDWEAYDIEVCGQAENGEEALELIEKLSPEILLIDISMPVMDGLQVIEALSKKNSSIKTIVLSGYDDFTYAQKAIKYGTSDYLLKPCRPQEILDTVLRLKLLIENEKDKNEKLEFFKQKFTESLPLLREKLLIKLIDGSKQSVGHATDDFSFYKINLTAEPASVAVFKIDDYANFSIAHTEKDMELFKFAVKNIADEIISDKLSSEVFESPDEIVAVINTPGEEDIALLYRLLEDVKASVRKFLNFSISIGIGKSYDIISEWSRSYDEARKSMSLKFFTGSDSIIKYEDIQEYAEKEITYPINKEKDLLNCIKTCKSDEIEEKLESFLTEISYKSNSKDYHLKSGLALLFSVYHLCIENNIETHEVFGNGLSSLDYILQMDTLSNLKSGLYEILSKVSEKFNTQRSKNSIVEFIVKYVDENCAKDLSLEAIAKEVFITPGYVSLLIKQHMGINFVDYLHKVRTSKACDLLKDKKLKMYEVAYRVGYKDEKYFSQVFKKYVGITPSQYREGLPL